MESISRKTPILLVMLLLQTVACKANYEESKTSHSAASVAAKRREIMEKIMLNYLQRLRKTRIEQVIDPYHDQGELQVEVRDGHLFGHKTFSQVRWNRVQADKLEVLRCAFKQDTEKACPNVRDLEFTDLEKKPDDCGYKECKRVREKIAEGTMLIDHSIVTSTSPEKKTSFQYLVRPCFENYLLLGKGASETLLKCGDKAIKSSNSAALNNRYLVQRACGESALLICGKSSLSEPYTKGKGVMHISTDLFDQREALIKQLEDLAMAMANEAQKGVKESLVAKDMPYEQRIFEAGQALRQQGVEDIIAHKKSCESKIKANAERKWWQNSLFWQSLAAAPFAQFSAASPDCYQAEEIAEAVYVHETTSRLGADAVSDAGKRSARDQAYINCAKDNINTLIDYYNSDRNLTAYDVNKILDVGIAMIPSPSSELNSRSTAQAVQMSLYYLTSGEEQACDPYHCPRCLKHAIKLRTYSQKHRNLTNTLNTVNMRIKSELISKGIKDPYATNE